MNKLNYLTGKHIPPSNTCSYKLLSILSDGLKHDKEELLIALKDDPRSPLQALKGKAYGYWLIHNIGFPKGSYQLDKRHLIGCREADMKARLEAEFNLRKVSRKQAERETIRLPRAIQEESEIKQRYQQSFKFNRLKTEKPTSIVKSKQA